MRKVKNSPLLYLACACGTHRSNSPAFQEKLQKAISGIQENDLEAIPENSGKNPETWSPTIATQSAPLLGNSEITNQPEPQKTAAKGGTLKIIAGFGLLLLAVGGLALKVAK